MIMRKLRVRLGVEPRKGETQQECKNRQDSTLREWAGTFRYAYNDAVRAVSVDPLDPARKPFPFNQELLRQRCTQTSVRNPEKFKEAREELDSFEVGELVNISIDHRLLDSDEDPRWMLRTPADIRNGAVRDLIAAEKSNREKKQHEIQRRAQHIAEGRPQHLCQKVHSWKLKYKQRANASAWTFSVTSQCIKNVRVQKRPERRMHHEDGRYEGQSRREWTRLELCPNGYDLGPIWLTEAVPGGKITTDCKMTLDMCGNWHLCIPVATEPPPPTVKPEAERRVVALDPGECIFQMGYCVDHTVAYGNKAEEPTKASSDSKRQLLNDPQTTSSKRKHLKGRLRWLPGNGGSDRLLDLCKKVDSTCKKMKHHELHPREKDNLRNQARRLRRKVRNLVDDAHRRISLDLVRNYDTILIPKFNVKEMTARKGEDGRRRILRSKTARSMLNWSHYRFRMFLIHKALKYGKEVVVCTERYTSKGCACCGRINTVGGSRWYKCAFCGHQGHRDGCAARNILLQYITK